MIAFLAEVSVAENRAQRKLDRVAGKKVAVIGMARSGMGMAKLLKSYGARVLVSDAKPKEKLGKEILALEELGVTWEAGGHTSSVWEGKDYIVVSPGVFPDIPILQKSRSQGIPIFSEIEVASWLCQATIVGITGSNGKTTTVTLLGEILKKAGREVKVAGNVGEAFSNLTDTLSPQGTAVLEISSFQLEQIADFKPHIATILNLSPDHLDRYSSFDDYVSAKLRIFENQDAGDYAVLNQDDQKTAEMEKKIASRIIKFGAKGAVREGVFVKQGHLVSNLGKKETKIISIQEIGIKGPHNLSNAACASAIALLLGVEIAPLASALSSFKGVEHRLEEVAVVNGVRFINDSKATNVDSVWNALQSVSSPIILIAGGKDKGSSYEPLGELIKSKVKLLVLIGEAAPKIRSQLGNLTQSAEATSLEKAVETAFARSQAGDTVLLSPACASFDMFDNYEHRGRVFKQAVKTLKEQSGRA